MDKSCTPFRAEIGLNPYIIRYWQFATNKFFPVKLDKGKMYNVKRSNLNSALKDIFNPKIKSLCLNDGPLCSEEDYISMKDSFISAFEKKFPFKSSFEI